MHSRVFDENVNCGNVAACILASLNPISSEFDHRSKALCNVHRLRRSYALGIRRSAKTTS